MKVYVEKMKRPVYCWWIYILLGVIYIGLACWLIFKSSMDDQEFYKTMGIFILINGSLELIFAISNSRSLSSWVWYLLGSLSDLTIGLIMNTTPNLTVDALPFIGGFWLMIRGFAGIGTITDSKQYGSSLAGRYLPIAILLIASSVALVWLPIIGVVSITIITSIVLILLGVFRVLLAIEMKDLYKVNMKCFEVRQY